MVFVIPEDIEYITYGYDYDSSYHSSICISRSHKCIIDVRFLRGNIHVMRNYSLLICNLYEERAMYEVLDYYNIVELYESIYTVFCESVFNDKYDNLEFVRTKIYNLYCRVFIKGERCPKYIIDYLIYLRNLQVERYLTCIDFEHISLFSPFNNVMEQELCRVVQKYEHSIMKLSYIIHILDFGLSVCADTRILIDHFKVQIKAKYPNYGIINCGVDPGTLDIKFIEIDLESI